MPVLEFGLPLLFTVLLWWFATGLIAWLDGLPRRTFGWSLAGATAFGGLGLWALWWSAAQDGVTGVVVAFVGAILVWGWNETAFLLGMVTGPERGACPADARGWRRFRLAVGVVLWHEMAILASAGLVAWASWGGVNPFGLWTFLLLWAMRISAKLNLFLGVPNLGHEFLPPHLAYMASWLRIRPMNLLFPLSVTGATATVLAFAALAVQAGPESSRALGHALLAALAFLALAEHWLMVLPLPSANLWSIYLGSRLRPDLPTQPAPLEASRP